MVKTCSFRLKNEKRGHEKLGEGWGINTSEFEYEYMRTIFFLVVEKECVTQVAMDVGGKKGNIHKRENGVETPIARTNKKEDIVGRYGLEFGKRLCGSCRLVTRYGAGITGLLVPFEEHPGHWW